MPDIAGPDPQSMVRAHGLQEVGSGSKVSRKLK